MFFITRLPGCIMPSPRRKPDKTFPKVEAKLGEIFNQNKPIKVKMKIFAK